MKIRQSKVTVNNFHEQIIFVILRERIIVHFDVLFIVLNF